MKKASPSTSPDILATMCFRMVSCAAAAAATQQSQWSILGCRMAALVMQQRLVAGASFSGAMVQLHRCEPLRFCEL